jgi:hypothetical protein
METAAQVRTVIMFMTGPFTLVLRFASRHAAWQTIKNANVCTSVDHVKVPKRNLYSRKDAEGGGT